MTAPAARTSPARGKPSPDPLPEGEGPQRRLHLQSGPIDLVIQAWGTPAGVERALDAARQTFPAILPTLCHELTHLRTELPSPSPDGPVARRMHAAVLPYTRQRITPMAAVAGAVADYVLAAMTAAAPLTKALVNNRGDIALHVTPGHAVDVGLVTDLATPAVDATLRIAAPCGLATSGRACPGRGGRSFSLGIADAVTILARTAAQADAAATIVANAVDLPGHPAIHRRPADSISPDSDLGARLVTWEVGPLDRSEIARALDVGRRVAEAMRRAGLIQAAVLALRSQVVTVQGPA